jgi:hypothetical protein
VYRNPTLEATMAFAPHTNDRRTIGTDPIILGQFREYDHGVMFEYAERLPGMFPADFAPEFPHIVYVGNGEYRAALVKKTVAYLAVDEDADGQAVTEKWYIKGHRAYDTAGL